MLRRFLRSFTRDERGQILIHFTILLPVLVGMIGLGLEGGRLLMLNSQLQDLADAAALAGAKELDGGNDAIDRATAMADSLLDNDPWWTFTANAGIQLDTSKTVFYEAVRCFPDCSKTPVDVTTTDQTKAIAIKVVTLTKSVLPAFLTVVGATAPGSTQATATAMTTPVACNVQPLMLCNPFEPSNVNFNDAVRNGTVKPGMMFHMKVLGSSTPGGGNDGNSYAPGDFGLLDPPGTDSSGANTTRNLISQQSPRFCYINRLSPRTGEAVSKVSDGINVRFDMKINGNLTGLDQAPAPNVLRGFTRDSCAGNPKYDPVLDSTTNLPAVMPGDTSYATYGNMQLGDGVLNGDATKGPTANGYWQTHHGGAAWPTDLNILGQANRWNAYKRELGLDGQAPPVTGAEQLGPMCAAPTAETIADRRIISVAVIDCITNGVRGNSQTDLRTNSYANFFITQPSVDYSPSGTGGEPNFNNNGEIWGEFVELITPSSGGNGKLHNIIQLIRDY